eukprot:TRINITY_DN39524_c0_g1_i1.p1 TRINITY_DN39524_c0_g1~~TRINITY_DN39524_c0_g1_i1.p1  ORF type:complete len:721 (+),score=124.93 TRINITY_DN39524_c0_g1_i1:144-2165(+)
MSTDPSVAKVIAKQRRASVEGVNGFAAGFVDVRCHDESPINVGSLSAREDIHTIRRKAFDAMMKKAPKAPVVQDDIDHIMTYVKSKMSDDKLDVRIELSAIREELLNEIRSVRDLLNTSVATLKQAQIDGGRTSQEFTIQCATRLEYQMETSSAMLEQEMQESCLDLASRIQQVQEVEWTDREHLARQIDCLGAELSAALAVRWSTCSAMFRQQQSDFRADLDSLAADLRREAAEHLGVAREVAASDLADALRWQATCNSERDEQNAAAHAESKARVDALESQISRHSDLVKQLDTDTCIEMHTKMANIRSSIQEDIQRLEQHEIELDRTIEAVEGVSTRRVEWLLQGVREQVTREQGTCIAWFSPSFAACGVRDLRLELRYSGTTELVRDAAKESRVRHSLTSGECVLLLWANDPGLRLVCQLFVGESSAKVEHVFDDTLGACTSGPLGSLQSHFARMQENELFCVGVEILESTRTLTGIAASKKGAAATSESDLATTSKELSQSRLAKADGTIVIKRHALFQSLESVLKHEQLLTTHLQSVRTERAETTQRFVRQQAKIDAGAAAIAKQIEQLGAVVATKVDIESFERRWEQDICGEVKFEIRRQQDRLGIALQKEDQLITMTEAMQSNLRTALALKGRGPAKLPGITTPRDASKQRPRRMGTANTELQTA